MRLTRKKRCFRVLVLLAWSALLVSACVSVPHPVIDLIGNRLSEWNQRTFSREVQYSLVSKDEVHELHSLAESSASALYKEVAVDLRATPWLNWEWQVNEFSHDSSQYDKSGDDFAARIYVVSRRGLLPLDSLSLNYVWSNDDQLHRWRNPFSNRSAMIAVNRRSDGRSIWFRHKVNVAEDFLRAFEEAVDEVHLIAIMTDSDNAGGRASAGYRRVYFSAR
ncbi:MAG: DUF3047 domain-containing protein [Pseudomonadota bacterium]